MAKLVPQNGFPICRAGHLGGRAVGGDYAPEADSQIARVFRHPEGPHPEIPLFVKDLDDGGLFQLQSVLGWLPHAQQGIMLLGYWDLP